MSFSCIPSLKTELRYTLVIASTVNQDMRISSHNLITLYRMSIPTYCCGNPDYRKGKLQPFFFFLCCAFLCSDISEILTAHLIVIVVITIVDRYKIFWKVLWTVIRNVPRGNERLEPWCSFPGWSTWWLDKRVITYIGDT